MPFVFLMFDSNSKSMDTSWHFLGIVLGVAAGFRIMREWDIERLFLPPSSEPDEYDSAEPPMKLTRPVQNKQADSSDVQKAVDDLVAQLDEQQSIVANASKDEQDSVLVADAEKEKTAA